VTIHTLHTLTLKTAHLDLPYNLQHYNLLQNMLANLNKNTSCKLQLKFHQNYTYCY